MKRHDLLDFCRLFAVRITPAGSARFLQRICPQPDRVNRPRPQNHRLMRIQIAPNLLPICRQFAYWVFLRHLRATLLRNTFVYVPTSVRLKAWNVWKARISAIRSPPETKARSPSILQHSGPSRYFRSFLSSHESSQIIITKTAIQLATIILSLFCCQ